MNTNVRRIIELNIAIIFMSTSGALARYIDLPVPMIIALRSIIASVLIFLYCKWNNFDFKIKKKDRGVMLLSGVLLGLHWITYFYALILSNIAIGMISLFTFPIITSFLEPILLKTKFHKAQILLGASVLVGIYFLVPHFDFENDHSKAVLFGVISAVLYSLRNIITKSRIVDYNGSVIMFYQLLIVAIFLSPTYVLYDVTQIDNQLPAILLLSLLTTAIGHTWFIYSFKNFSTTSVSIMSSSQPIYGILIGIVFLNEFPTSSAIIGGLIILSTVILESVLAIKIQASSN